MEFLLDTIHLATIKKYRDIIPLSGVTSNPSIVKKEGRVAFFQHMRQIRQLIGSEATLHAQVVGTTTTDMIADAHTLLDQIDQQLYIKVPTNEAGLAAMKTLKHEGIHVTATAIYTALQGYLAIAAGADYLAPYYNRMINLGIDANAVIDQLAQQIQREQSTTKILAASFHTVEQVTSALKNGAQAVTMGPDVLQTGLGLPIISDAVKNFSQDWVTTYGDVTIAELAENKQHE